MPTFNITNRGVTVTDDRGDEMTVDSSHHLFKTACEAVMTDNWKLFADVVFAVELTAKEPDVDEFGSLNVPQLVLIVSGLLEDHIISPIDLGISIPATHHGAQHEHDLSQWNGSPIFYPTREMARAQSDRWGMFWDYHDFGQSAPAGYRYATVPRGVGPTAPDGYDWVCLPREED